MSVCLFFCLVFAFNSLLFFNYFHNIIVTPFICLDYFLSPMLELFLYVLSMTLNYIQRYGPNALCCHYSQIHSDLECKYLSGSPPQIYLFGNYLYWIGIF